MASSSGQSAQFMAISTIAGAGDNIVSSYVALTSRDFTFRLFTFLGHACMEGYVLLIRIV